MKPGSQVRVVGWSAGMKKVGVTQLLRMELKVALPHAKALTDAILDGRNVVLSVHSEGAATRLCEQLRELGVQAEVQSDGVPG